MALKQHLARKAVCADLEATDRDAALAEILDALLAGGYIDKRDYKPILAGLLEREKLGSTAIGKGMAVPHCKGRHLEEIWVAFGRSGQGVQFRSLDGAPVHAIFLVVYPQERPPEYLTVMQGISRAIQHPDFGRFVQRAHNVNEIIDLIEEMS
jgi:mannitol/fructose-specific phosphotransferase system IIA component (Ntr-type)